MFRGDHVVDYQSRWEISPLFDCCACLYVHAVTQEPWISLDHFFCCWLSMQLHLNPKKPSNDSAPKWITWKICFYEVIGKAPRGLTYMVKSTPNELHNQIYSNKERPPDGIWTMREKPIHREDRYGCKCTNPAEKYEHRESNEDLFNGEVPRVCNPELS